MSEEEAPQEATTEVTEAPQEHTPFYQELPETWRDDIVSGLELGESEQNVLNRYTDFPTFARSFFEQHKKIRSGLETPSGLPENATEDQVKEWREANGIPNAPEEYKSTLPTDMVLSGEDERVLGAVWQAALGENVKPQTLAKLQEAMFAARAEEGDRVIQQHGLDKQKAERHLKDHWGPDYETNLNALRGLINTIPAEQKELFEQAELMDGTKIFNNPVMVQWLSDIAKQLNPGATVVPNAQNPVEAVKGEIEKIEKLMREDPDTYWKDEAMQRRYEKLLEAEENMRAA